MAYCNRVSVKMASENSSEDDFETLHGAREALLIRTDRKTWSGVDKVAATASRSWYSARSTT